MVKYEFYWPEMAAFVFLLMGFVLSLFSAHSWMVYIVSIISGLFFGRIWFMWRKRNQVPIFLSIMTFFLGLVVGSLYANIRAVAILLLIGMCVSYWAHEEKLVE